jgi:hypothetical protein
VAESENVPHFVRKYEAIHVPCGIDRHWALTAESMLRVGTIIPHSKSTSRFVGLADCQFTSGKRTNMLTLPPCVSGGIPVFGIKEVEGVPRSGRVKLAF